MSLPVIAIVGRPNVGKSSLLNALAGRRIAIVDPTPGVTRDRICAPLAVGEGYAELVDTGGMGIQDVDQLTEQVESQILYAIGEAAMILFVVDAREGVTTLDRHAAATLRRQDKPVLLLANKMDQVDLPSQIHELHELGFGEPLPISAAHCTGLSAVLEAVCRTLGDKLGDRPVEPVMKLAIVGKRNAGKSALINALAGQERVIVSETPGTTRDSVDVTIGLDGKTFTLIDTAGIRKRKSVAGDIEFYSLHRAMRSIRRADVVALVIDASVPVSQVDKDLAGDIVKLYKPVVIVVNKWDLARPRAGGEDYADYFAKTFPELSYAPISLTTATTGQNVRQTILLAEELFRQAATRVDTAQLNVAMAGILQQRGPSHKVGTKPPKILYATQVATAPPTIVCFVNDARSFDQGYQRFLLNQLRQRLGFAEVPVRLLLRGRRRGASKT
jgi:GTP-binding protein